MGSLSTKMNEEASLAIHGMSQWSLGCWPSWGINWVYALFSLLSKQSMPQPLVDQELLAVSYNVKP